MDTCSAVVDQFLRCGGRTQDGTRKTLFRNARPIGERQDSEGHSHPSSKPTLVTH